MMRCASAQAPSAMKLAPAAAATRTSLRSSAAAAPSTRASFSRPCLALQILGHCIGAQLLDYRGRPALCAFSAEAAARAPGPSSLPAVAPSAPGAARPCAYPASAPARAARRDSAARPAAVRRASARADSCPGAPGSPCSAGARRAPDRRATRAPRGPRWRGSSRGIPRAGPPAGRRVRPAHSGPPGTRPAPRWKPLRARTLSCSRRYSRARAGIPSASETRRTTKKNAMNPSSNSTTAKLTESSTRCVGKTSNTKPVL